MLTPLIEEFITVNSKYYLTSYRCATQHFSDMYFHFSEIVYQPGSAK